MKPDAGVRALTLLSLFQSTDTFCSRDFTSLPLFPTRDITKSTIENATLQTRYRSIIPAKHGVLINPSSN